MVDITKPYIINRNTMITLHITKTLDSLGVGQAVRFDTEAIWQSAQSERKSAILDNAPSVKDHAEKLARLQGVTTREVDSGKQWEFFKSNSELMLPSKSTENPDTLPDDIRDTYHRLYG